MLQVFKANTVLRRCVYSQCEGIARTRHSSYISWGSITPYINLSQPADRLPIKSWLCGSLEKCGRSKQAGYVVYWRCVRLRAGKGIQLLEGGEGTVRARDRNWRIGGCLRIGKRGRGFSGFAPLHYNTVSLYRDVISRIEMQIICRRIQSATSAYL